ncbi:MAG: endonuclease/exonuclease/phosphatase family protein [Prevotellaceae bacterium]|nr:endonuclease/exonuclease/phosphatase family protein [Prevotellaceae bacterium]
MSKIFTAFIMILSLSVCQTWGEDLKVMSFNIRFNNPKDTADNSWAARKMPCARMFQKVQPDVIGMQEPRGEEQIDDIKAMLPEYTPIETIVPEGFNVNKAGRIMIFFKTAKFRMKKHGQFWLNEDTSKPAPSFETTDKNNLRAALWTKLQDKESGKVFYFVTTHFPYKQAAEDNTAREKCAALIVEQMKKIAGEKATVFVTGDMNASFDLQDGHRISVRPFYEWMKTARDMARQTDASSTFNGFKVQTDARPKVLDHIFYRNAEPQHFKVYNEKEFGVRFISDHFPIVCDFEY